MPTQDDLEWLCASRSFSRTRLSFINPLHSSGIPPLLLCSLTSFSWCALRVGSDEVGPALLQTDSQSRRGTCDPKNISCEFLCQVWRKHPSSLLAMTSPGSECYWMTVSECKVERPIRRWPLQLLSSKIRQLQIGTLKFQRCIESQYFFRCWSICQVPGMDQ